MKDLNKKELSAAIELINEIIDFTTPVENIMPEIVAVLRNPKKYI